MVGRILGAADFQRVLSQTPLSRSAHFALHHVAARPLPLAAALKKATAAELSTAHAPVIPSPVDDLVGQWWLGLVVPKRHARRSVTRSLLKRQMREVVRGVVSAVDLVSGLVSAEGTTSALRGPALPPGLWVLRLKAPFDKQQFPSAASAALRASARAELTQLVRRAALTLITAPTVVPVPASARQSAAAAVAPGPR